jgi:WD domain, G-beta repeat
MKMNALEQGLKLLVQCLTECAPLILTLVQKSFLPEKAGTIINACELIKSYSNIFQDNPKQTSFEQHKLLQKELALSQRETQLKIAADWRETTLQLPEISKILDRWALKLYPSQILESHLDSRVIPLKVFLVPPQLSNDADVESKLAEELRIFLNKNYSLHDLNRPTEFLAGAWDERQFFNESSIKTLFGLLKSEPSLIIALQIEGNSLYVRIAYWGLGQENYYYQTLARFPYLQILSESAKKRALKWKEIQDKLLALGESLHEVSQLGGDNAINLALLEKEEKWQAQGIDIAQIALNYQINAEDIENLTQFLSTCCCLVTGWIADIYHLIYRDISPLLPSLLPSLRQQITDAQLIAAIANGYRQVYQTLENERRYWVPELSLQLACSLTYLSEKSWATEQIYRSLQSWLHLRQISLSSDANPLEAMKPALTLADRNYLEKLKDCFLQLGNHQDSDRVEALIAELPLIPSIAIAATPKEPNDTRQISLVYTLTEQVGKISSVAIAPDGEILASSCSNKTITLWDLRTGNPIRTIEGHSEDVSSIAISPDGQFLASSSVRCPKSNVKVWNLKSGKLLHSHLGHKRSVRFVAIDSQARILVSGSNKIKLWDLHTGDRICTLWHPCAVNAATISPDGQLLVSGGSDGKIKLWNPRTGDPLRTLKGHTDAINAIAISPDGELAIAGSADAKITIWHLKTGKLQATLTGHSEKINALAISPDGKFLISGSSDRTIAVWHLKRGELWHSLKGHSGSVNSVAISADGRTLVSGSSDKTIAIWRIL